MKRIEETWGRNRTWGGRRDDPDGVVAVAAVFLVHPPPGRDCPRGVEMRPERERLAPPTASRPQSSFPPIATATRAARFCIPS